MAKYVIERQGDRYFIKKTRSEKEQGKDITDVVGYLYARYGHLHDGQTVTLWNSSSTSSKVPFERIRDARDLAERMRDVMQDETGVDCLDGKQTSQRSVQRSMIAYRLRLLGFPWVVAASAVDRNVPCCMKHDPRSFVNDNEGSLWNKILKVR